MIKIDYEKDISVKTILQSLLLVGVVTIAVTSPYFLYNLAKILFKNINFIDKDKIKFKSSFYYLAKRGLIKVEKNGHDVKFFITEKGKINLRKYKVDKLKINKPKKWDKKWRVVIFDIPDTQKLQRNAFRWKLKSLDFYSLQKSVWLHPFNCKNEIEILREFLKIDKSRIQILVVDKIENDLLVEKIKELYKL